MLETFDTICVECGVKLTIIRDNKNTKDYYCAKCKLNHPDKFKYINKPKGL